MFTAQFQAWVRRHAMAIMTRLRRLPITPNQVTLAGLGVTALAALLVGLDHPFLGGLVLLFAGLFDILDGALARASDRSYPYGAFLDSTTDRVAEGVVMVGLVVYFQRHQVGLGPVLVVLATAGSFLVSYVRARAQSLGFSCEGGLLARPERVLLTVAGLLLTPFLRSSAILVVAGVLALFTNLTAFQRVWIVWRQTRPVAASTLRAEVRPAPPETPRAEEREVRPGPEPVL
jgi:CDP-diacylglycerol--glycerol-3-phosphate 3-phosphatidyltransferase